MPITNSREIRSLRDSLRLSERQRKILTGSLLGDGCLVPNWRKKHYRLQIEQNESHKAYVFWFYTQSFTYEENLELQRRLAENFGLLHTSLHKDKDRVRLYVRSKSLARLRELIEPYLLSEFTYKLPKPRRDLSPAVSRSG